MLINSLNEVWKNGKWIRISDLSKHDRKMIEIDLRIQKNIDEENKKIFFEDCEE